MTLTSFLYAAENARLESVVAMTQWLAGPHPTQMSRDMWAVEQLMPTLRSASVTMLNPEFRSSEFMASPLWRGDDHDRYERQIGVPTLAHSLYAMEDEHWKAKHLTQVSGESGCPAGRSADRLTHAVPWSVRRSPSEDAHS